MNPVIQQMYYVENEQNVDPIWPYTNGTSFTIP